MIYSSIRLEKKASSQVYQNSYYCDLPSKSKKSKPNIEGYFDLISFNETIFDEFHCKEYMIGKEETFVKIKALISCELKELFIDLKKYPELLDRVKCLSVEEATQKINDYVLDILGINSILVKNTEAFIYLGIGNEIDQKIIMSSKSEDIALLPVIFDRLFSGNTIEDKITSYEIKKHKLQSSSHVLMVLNKIFIDGLAIKIFKDEVPIYKLGNYSIIEFKIANQAKTDLKKAICKAYFCGCESLVLFLLMNSKNQKNVEFIFLNSALYGQEFLIKSLFENYSSIISTECLRDAVLNASLKGNESIVNFLLSKNLSNIGSVLNTAALYGQEFLIKSLFENYSSIISTEDLRDAVINASLKGYEFIVNFLLSKDLSNVDIVFTNAAFYGRLSLVKNIFENYGSEISSESLKNAVVSASQKGNKLIVEYFLDKDCENLFQAVNNASLCNQKDLVKYLLEKYSDKFSDEDLKIVIKSALKKGHQYIVDYFLSKNPKNLVIIFTTDDYIGQESLIEQIFKKYCYNIADKDLKIVIKYSLKKGYKSIVYFILNNLINIKIPSLIKETILKIRMQPPALGNSWENLLEKLRVFVFNIIDEELKDSMLKILYQTFERIRSETPFLGTPAESNRDLLSAWYRNIKDIMSKIDSKIDIDPTKDIEEKKNFLEAFGLCGGAWQSYLDQIKQRLLDFPVDSPVEIFIGKIISDIAIRISESINEEYAKNKDKYPDVHDQTKIKFYLREYLAEEVLDDHLSTLSMSFCEVMVEFLEKFDKEVIIDEILMSIRENAFLKDKLDDYYKTQLFKECESSDEIELKIEEDKIKLERKLEKLEENQSIFSSLSLIMGDISFDDKISILNLLVTFPNKELFKIKFNSLNEEQINKLFDQKAIIFEMLNFLRKLKYLFNNFSYQEILTNTKEQLIQLFIDNKQSRIEFHLIENFRNKHVRDENLLSSGIEIILRKMGFFKF